MGLTEGMNVSKIETIVSNQIGRDPNLLATVEVSQCLGVRKVLINIFNEKNTISTSKNLDIENDTNRFICEIAELIRLELKNSGYSVSDTINAGQGFCSVNFRSSLVPIVIKENDVIVKFSDNQSDYIPEQNITWAK